MDSLRDSSPMDANLITNPTKPTLNAQVTHTATSHHSWYTIPPASGTLTDAINNAYHTNNTYKAKRFKREVSCNGLVYIRGEIYNTMKTLN